MYKKSIGSEHGLSGSRSKFVGENKLLFITMRNIIYFTEKGTTFVERPDDNTV